METDKSREQRWLEYVQAKEQKNKPAQRIFNCIELSILGLMIACIIFCQQYAPIFFIWFFLNSLIYHQGCSWLCIDEYDLDNTSLGLKIMFKSWKVQIPMYAIAAVLILTNHPLIALIYGIIALFFFKLYQDLNLFDF